MNYSLAFIKALMFRPNYLRLSKYLTSIEHFEHEIKVLVKVVEHFYAEFQVDVIRELDFKIFFENKYPIIKNKELYLELITKVFALDTTSEMLDKVCLTVLKKEVAANMAKLCLDVMDNPDRELVSEADELLRTLKQADSEHEKASPFVEDTLAELIETELTGAGVNWRLPCLQSDIGPLCGGSLGHVFARVDTGKTTFLASEVSYFSHQLKDDEVIIWCNNEERGRKVKLRIYSAICGMSVEEIKANPEQALDIYRDMGGDRVKLYDNAVISVYDIERLLKEHNTRVLVIDQGDKIQMRGNFQKNTDRLTALYGRFREMAKSFPNLDIITAGQASAEAVGQKWLTLNWMSESKTGKPGELDYAIGIGVSNRDGEDMLRYISLCKNKMNQGAHGKHTVSINTQIAQYQGVE